MTEANDAILNRVDSEVFFKDIAFEQEVPGYEEN